MKIIGHRGAKGLAPENTLAAIEKALEHGVDEIECDVRVTSDGVAVLIHDHWLHDQAGNRLEVNAHNLEELRTHKANLTTLVQAAEMINHTVPLQIEVKTGVAVEPIVQTLRALFKKGWKASDFLLASKNFTLLKTLHTALPDIPTVVIEPWSGVRASRRASKLGTKRISMNQLWLWRGFITPVCRRGWQLSAYTLNDPRKARRWAGYGLYGVITDYPDQFKKATNRES